MGGYQWIIQLIATSVAGTRIQWIRFHSTDNGTDRTIPQSHHSPTIHNSSAVTTVTDATMAEYDDEPVDLYPVDSPDCIGFCAGVRIDLESTDTYNINTKEDVDGRRSKENVHVS